MSPIGRTPVAQRIAHTLPGDGSRSADERWHELVSQIGAEIAGPLTAALERINTLASTGRIDRASLRALREEVEARTPGRHDRPAADALRLRAIAPVARAAATGRCAERRDRPPDRETTARGIDLKPSLKPAEVIVDASLLFGVLNTPLDWALEHARSQHRVLDRHQDLADACLAWPAASRTARSTASTDGAGASARAASTR